MVCYIHLVVLAGWVALADMQRRCQEADMLPWNSSHFRAYCPQRVEGRVDKKPAQKHAGRQASTLDACGSTDAGQVAQHSTTLWLEHALDAGRQHLAAALGQ
jgi:hypothetical protein